MPLVEELEIVARDQRDVVPALAQGRNADHNSLEAVVQVLAETSLPDHVFQILVGRRHDAGVDLDRLRASETFELLLLQHPEQLRLSRWAQIADLVEEDRPAVGELELPGPPPVSTREGAPLVPEELAFDQRIRDCGAVDREEAPPPARLVDRPGHELLARTGLAIDQHGSVARPLHGDPSDHLVLHDLVAADDVADLSSAEAHGIALEEGILPLPVFRLVLPDRPLDDRQHLVPRHGLRDVLPDADRPRLVEDPDASRRPPSPILFL